MNDEIILNADEDDDTIFITPLADSANQTPGLIVSARVDSTINAPIILNGEIVLPPSGSGSGINSVIYSTTASNPYIANNQIVHPYAQFYGTTTRAGVIAGIEFISSVAPIIENGKIELPFAHFNNGSSVAGVITGLRTSSVLAPAIINGELQLPLNMAILGVADKNGRQHYWEDIGMSTAAVEVARWTDFALSVYQENGFINFMLHS